jgi:glucose/arabinose dehydrogenase
LFVLEQAGRVRVVTDGKAGSKPFLDITTQVFPGGEMGLLGLAFHPAYQQNGYFYVNYIDKNQQTTIARFKAHGNVADPTSEKILFTLKQPYANHNGGGLAFGPDGYLYASLGDGGSAGDPENRAQNKANFFGKILRLDVDKGDLYEVPSNNPFIHEADAKPEIWAYGLRNPWRISFDKKTGDLYIADVGQGDFEEVNIQRAGSKGGENYGWRCYEGRHSFKLGGCDNGPSSYAAPSMEYTHDDGRCSITGGYVYRGTKYPAFDSKYFYGDYCNGQLFYATPQNGKWQQTQALKTPYTISTFGQGSDGELYFADYKSGAIYHIRDMAN